jgi:hypothetical protein
MILFISNTCILAQSDSIPQQIEVTKKPGLAFLETFVLNLTLNRYDAWFFHGSGADWAKVSPSSWARNFQVGLEWDVDKFGTNFFGHPFHGSFYFNSSRSLGLSYWESAPIVFVSSATWEYFGETLAPSGNDLITTTIGGIHLGEITHRISENLLHYPSTGFGRIWRHVLATLLNPMGAFNHWVTGAPKYRKSSKNGFKKDIKGSLSLGSNFQLRALNLETKGPGSYLEFEAIYGDPFQDKDFYKPFEFFEFKTWLRFTDFDDRPYPYLNIKSEGILWGKNISYGKNHSLLAGAFQHFDYLHDEVIELGSIGFSAGLHLRYYLGKSFILFAQMHAGPSVLGGSNNEIVDEFINDPDSERDYIIGAGFLSKTEILIEHFKAGQLSANFRHFTFDILDGPDGVERLHLLSFRYSIPIWKGHKIGMDYSRYFRRVNYFDYIDFQDIKKDLYEFRLFIGVGF